MDVPSALRQWAGADPASARPAGLARIGSSGNCTPVRTWHGDAASWQVRSTRSRHRRAACGHRRCAQWWSLCRTAGGGTVVATASRSGW